jgi:hypothetical protein
VDRGDLVMNATLGRFSFDISHMHLAGRITTNGLREDRLSMGLSCRIMDKVYSRGGFTSDLAQTRVDSFTLTIGYEDNCYRAELSTVQRKFRNSGAKDDKPSFAFIFRTKTG